MDYEFEHIIPWNGEHDTGYDARMKLQRNFERVKANFEEVETSIAEVQTAFDDLFEKVETSAGKYAIKAKYGFYSVGSVSALGYPDEEGGGTGGGSGIDEGQLWQILGNTGTEQIAKNHLTTALSEYITASTASNLFAASADLAQTNSNLASVSNKLDDFLEGSDTDTIINKWKELEAFLNGMSESDNLAEILLTKADKSWTETQLGEKLDKTTFEDLFEKVETSAGKYAIKAKYDFYSVGGISAMGYTEEEGGCGSGLSGIKVNGSVYEPVDGYITIPDYPTELSWAAVTGKPSTLAGYGITDAVTLSTEQSISGQKTFQKVIYQGPNLANRRALSFVDTSNNIIFADVNDPTIIRGSTVKWQRTNGTDSLILDNVSLRVNTELKVVDDTASIRLQASGSYGYLKQEGAYTILENPSGDGVPALVIRTGLTTDGLAYRYSNNYYPLLTTQNYGTTLNDVYLRKDNYSSTLDSRYVNVSGDTMTGVLRIVEGNANVMAGLQTAGGSALVSYVGEDTYLAMQKGTTRIRSGATSLLHRRNGTDYTIWDSYNDGPSSGLDADLLDGTHKNGLFTALSSSSGTNLSVTIGGTTKSISALYSASATKLQTSRTIWGQSFNGTANVSGTLSSVGGINFSSGGYFSVDSYGSFKATSNSDSYYWSVKRYDGTSGISVSASSGNVGIGTAPNSSYKLYVSGSSYMNGSHTNIGNFYMHGDYWFMSGTNGTGIYFKPESNGNLNINGHNNNSYTRQIIGIQYSNGYVGIGTSAPSYKLHVNGDIYSSTNILANGAITAKSVSDIRLKDISPDRTDYQQVLLDLGMVVDFYYNDAAICRNVGSVDRKRHIGLIYQNAVKPDLANFCHKENDGFGSINYIAPDYINLIAGACQLNILGLRNLAKRTESVEQRVARLERENMELRQILNAMKITGSLTCKDISKS